MIQFAEVCGSLRNWNFTKIGLFAALKVVNIWHVTFGLAVYETKYENHRQEVRLIVSGNHENILFDVYYGSEHKHSGEKMLRL